MEVTFVVTKQDSQIMPSELIHPQVNFTFEPMVNNQMQSLQFNLEVKVYKEPTQTCQYIYYTSNVAPMFEDLLEGVWLILRAVLYINPIPGFVCKYAHSYLNEIKRKIKSNADALNFLSLNFIILDTFCKNLAYVVLALEIL